MKKLYIVTLTDQEREGLPKLIGSGKGSARELTRARILLKADAAPGGPGWTDGRIGEVGGGPRDGRAAA